MEQSLATISDNIGDYYRARSKESRLSEKEREAARLVATAEDFLHDEQPEKSRKKADEGLKIFRELADEVGIADIIRIIVHCLCSEDRRKDGNRIAKEELERIRAGTDRRGEGKMLLAIAVVNTERRGTKNRLEAKTFAEESLRIFRSQGDASMEAHARLVLLNIGMKLRESVQETCQAGVEHGIAARALFKSCGNKRNEGLALHGIALIHVRATIRGDCVIRGFPGGWQAASAEAVRCFREARCFKMLAFQKVCIAQWNLGAPEEARVMAEEAMRLCQEHKSRHEPNALTVLVQSYLKMQDRSKNFVNDEAETAIELAQKGLERSRELDNRFGEANALHLLVNAYQAKRDRQQVIKLATQAVEIYRELGEKSGETSMLQILSQTHLDANDVETASQLAQEVAEMNFSLHETFIAQQTQFEAYLRQGDAAAALKVAEELVIKCSDKNDARRESTARVMVANVHFSEGNFEQAIQLGREAQALLHDARLWQDEGAVLCNIAESYLSNNQLPEALKAAERSLRLLQGKDKKKFSGSLLLLAQIRLSVLSQEKMQRQRGSATFAAAFKNGMQAADAAIALSRQAGFREDEGKALIIAGHLQHAASQTAESLGTAEEAKAIFEELGDQCQVANVLCMQADAHLGDNNPEKALVLVNKALAIFQDHGDRRGEHMAMKILDHITGPQVEQQPVIQDQWTPEQWAQWKEWQKQQAKGAGKGNQGGPPAQLQKVQQNQRQSRAVTGDKLNMNSLSVETVRTRLNEIVKATVGLEETEEFDLDQPLMQVGITSRSAVELRNTLSEEIPGVDLPFTLIFDYPSVASISDMVLDSVGNLAG